MNQKYIKKETVSFFPAATFFLVLAVTFLLLACSFDYGDGQGDELKRPDIVMEDIEYNRVRGGDLLASFKAEHAERWEELQIMRLRDFSFEQMEDHGETVNVEGTAGAAEVRLESGDISLSGGVSISIASEDISISTVGIEWKDKEKTLSGGEEDKVDVRRSDGTSFSGIGFSADIRSRAYSFSGEVEGSFVEEEEEGEEE